MANPDPQGSNVTRCGACKGSGLRKGYRGPCAFCGGAGYTVSKGQSARDMLRELRRYFVPIREMFVQRGWPLGDLLTVTVIAVGRVAHGNGSAPMLLPDGAAQVSEEWGRLALLAPATAQNVIDELKITVQ